MAGCDRPDGDFQGFLWRNWLISASGYAAVWAREKYDVKKFLML